MKIYHGSDTLSKGVIPDTSEASGIFFSLNSSFAAQFGEEVHSFEIDESNILDFRNKSHLKLINQNKIKDILDQIETHQCGLPFAFNHDVSITSLEAVQDLCKRLGFGACYFIESTGDISLEVWDRSLIKSTL